MMYSTFLARIFNMLRAKVKLWVLLVWCVVGQVEAAQVELVGLSKDKAFVSIDGTRHLLAVSERSPEGVKLISVGDDHAVLEVAGKQGRYSVGQSGSLSTRFDVPEVTEVRIAPDTRGMFYTSGSINGTAVKFLVDTGATAIALSGSQARRLGIDFKHVGLPIRIATASGISKGYMLKLDRVNVGSIELFQVEAVIIDGNMPSDPLLGNSFLNRVEMARDNGYMKLRKK